MGIEHECYQILEELDKITQVAKLPEDKKSFTSLTRKLYKNLFTLPQEKDSLFKLYEFCIQSACAVLMVPEERDKRYKEFLERKSKIPKPN